MIEFPIIFPFNTSVLFEFGNSRNGGSTGGGGGVREKRIEEMT